MWHVSNELGGHNGRCYCDVSAAAFREWLRARYADVDALNLAWGTAFWGQRYSSFEQILPPRRTTAFPNPGQRLDFERFSSDQFVEHLAAEAAVLREVTPHLPVTTNYMVTADFQKIDYTTTTPLLDIVANDHYLWAEDPRGWAELAFSADRTRGLAGGSPVDPHGALHERGQLAAAQHRQGARADAAQLAAARRPRRRRGALLPVAAVPRRCGEVPLRDGSACRTGLAAVPGRGRPGRDPGPARGGAGERGREGSRRDPLGHAGVVGRRARGPPHGRPALPRPRPADARCAARRRRRGRRPARDVVARRLRRRSGARRSISRRRTSRTG